MALGRETQKVGHSMNPFGTPWWSIDMEERAAATESPISYCAESGRAYPYSPEAR